MHAVRYIDSLRKVLLLTFAPVICMIIVDFVVHNSKTKDSTDVDSDAFDFHFVEECELNVTLCCLPNDLKGKMNEYFAKVLSEHQKIWHAKKFYKRIEFYAE